MHVFGVVSDPSSVTVNGSPITSFSYNPTTKVILSSVLVVIRTNNGNRKEESPFRCDKLMERRFAIVRFCLSLDYKTKTDKCS